MMDGEMPPPGVVHQQHGEMVGTSIQQHDPQQHAHHGGGGGLHHAQQHHVHHSQHQNQGQPLSKRESVAYVVETDEEVVLPPPASSANHRAGAEHSNVTDLLHTSFINMEDPDLAATNRNLTTACSKDEGSIGMRTRGRTRSSTSAAAKKQREKRKYQMIKCDHASPDHFFRSYVENAIKENKASIMMNASMANSSLVWGYCGFPKINGEVCINWLVCTLCNSVFAYTDGATSGPKRHVLVKHMNLPGNFTGNVHPMGVIGENGAERCEAVQTTLSLEYIGGNDADDGVYDTPSSSSKPPKTRRGKKSAKQDSSTNRNSGSSICTICNVDFRNLALYMIHQSCHGPRGNFQCAQCFRELSNVFDFWAHLHERQCESD